METLKHLRYELPSLTVYRTLRNDPVIHGFEMLSELLGTGAPLEQLLDTYSELDVYKRQTPGFVLSKRCGGLK